MKAKILGAVAAVVLAVPAIAADIPVKAPVGKAPFLSNFDVAFGGALMTDYIFRGVSQSNGAASVGAYVEGQWTTSPGTVYYLGLAGASIKWPDANTLSEPSMELDVYGGVRLTQGKWSYDLGIFYYHYPNETVFDSEFLEFYAKAAYAVSDALTVGGAIYYSPDYLNYGKHSWYSSVNAKYTMKNTYVSGELAYMAFESGPTAGGVSIPDYLYWNVGIGWTWKQFTLDLRYHDTDMNAAACINVWNAPGAAGTSTANTCGSAWVAKLSFDTTVSAHK